MTYLLAVLTDNPPEPGLVQTLLPFAALSALSCLGFLPTILAIRYQHRRTVWIYVLNCMFGWTIIGWIAAIVWACRRPKPVANARAPL